MTRVRGRDVTEQLLGKIDPAVMQVLVRIAEYQSAQRQQIQELASLVNSSVDEIGKLASVVGAFKSRLAKYDRHLPKGLESEDA